MGTVKLKRLSHEEQDTLDLVMAVFVAMIEQLNIREYRKAHGKQVPFCINKRSFCAFIRWLKFSNVVCFRFPDTLLQPGACLNIEKIP